MKRTPFITVLFFLILAKSYSSETFSGYKGEVLLSGDQIVTKYPLNYFIPGVNWSHHIFDFTVDASNSKIFTIPGEGILRYDNTDWELTTLDDEPILENVGSITSDTSGYIYYEIMDYGIVKTNGKSRSIITIEDQISQFSCEHIFIDNRQRLWAGMNAAGLIRYMPEIGSKTWGWNVVTKGEEFTVDDWISNTINAICEDSSQVIWVATPMHIRSLSDRLETIYTNAGDESLEFMKGLASGSGETVWACGSQQIFKFSGKEWEEVPIPKQMKHNDFYALTVDANDNLWVMGNELYKYDGEEWFNLPISGSDYVRAIQFDERGVLWIAEDLNIYSVEEVLPLSKPVSVSTNEIDGASKCEISPNPVSDKLCVSGLTEQAAYRILAVTGEPFLQGSISPSEFIDTSELPNGMYLLMLNGTASLFVKQ